MNDFENVSELVNKTGAGFEEARYAYEACGKDMVSAAVMLEKAKRSRTNSAEDTQNSKDQGFRRNRRAAANYAGEFFRKLCRNNMRISGSREYFCIPVIAAVITALLLWEIIIPVVLISVFCGIRYTFSGPDISKDFVFGFSRPADTAHSAPNYSYQKNDDCDNGFFNN